MAPNKLKLVNKAKEKEENKIQKAKNGITIDRCEDCKRSDLVTNHVEGTVVCRDCGLVQLSRIIDDSSEWRTFSSETANGGSNPSRVGGKLNPYLSNYGIDTQVTGKGAADIQRWNQRSSLNSKDKLISEGHRMIKENEHILNLKESAMTKAKEIFKRVEDEGVLKGKSVKAKAAGAIFMGSLMAKQPKQGKQIQSVFDIRKKELSNCITAIRKLYP